MKKIILIIIALFLSTYSNGQQIFSNGNYTVEEEQLGFNYKGEYAGFFDGGMTYFEAIIFDVHKCFFSKTVIVKGSVVEKYSQEFAFYAHGFIGKRSDKKVDFLRSFKLKDNEKFKVKVKPNEKIYFEYVGYSTLELIVLKSSVVK